MSCLIRFSIHWFIINTPQPCVNDKSVVRCKVLTYRSYARCVLWCLSASVSLLVMLYCLSRARSWSWSFLSLSVDPEDFLVSVGVIIFSYTSQIFLPPLEGSMEDRGQFDAMLGWTHAAACIMKTMFSFLVRRTAQDETDSSSNHRWLIDWLLPPSGRADLGGRDQRGHYRQPALWPPTPGQPVPAGQSPAVLPSAVLLCSWDPSDLSAARWSIPTANQYLYHQYPQVKHIQSNSFIWMQQNSIKPH